MSRGKKIPAGQQVGYLWIGTRRAELWVITSGVTPFPRPAVFAVWLVAYRAAVFAAAQGFQFVDFMRQPLDFGNRFAEFVRQRVAVALQLLDLTERKFVHRFTAT
jgi:hypothetical protein